MLILGSARAKEKYVSACGRNVEEMVGFFFFGRGELGFALVLSGELGGGASHPALRSRVKLV